MVSLSSKDHQGIRYLEYCVEHLKTTEEAIHNYLLSLYAQIQDERPVLSFVKRACEVSIVFPLPPPYVTTRVQDRKETVVRSEVRTAPLRGEQPHDGLRSSLFRYGII